MQKDLSKAVYTTWITTEKDRYQVAKVCNISIRHVYYMLKEYCDANGISYKDTLMRPHKQHIKTKYKVARKEATAYEENFKCIRLLLEDVINVQSLLKAIDSMERIVCKLLEEME